MISERHSADARYNEAIVGLLPFRSSKNSGANPPRSERRIVRLTPPVPFIKSDLCYMEHNIAVVADKYRARSVVAPTRSSSTRLLPCILPAAAPFFANRSARRIGEPSDRRNTSIRRSVIIAASPARYADFETRGAKVIPFGKSRRRQAA